MRTRPASPISGIEATLPTAWSRREDLFVLERERLCLADWFCVARVHEAGVFAPMEDFNLDIPRCVTERIGAFVSIA